MKRPSYQHHSTLNAFASVVAILEAGVIYDPDAEIAVRKIIDLCNQEQQKQLRKFDAAIIREKKALLFEVQLNEGCRGRHGGYLHQGKGVNKEPCKLVGCKCSCREYINKKLKPMMLENGISADRREPTKE